MKIRERSFPGTVYDTLKEYEIEGRSLSRCAASEGMVLLKNEGGILPLEEGSSLDIYGPGALYTVKGGTGSGDVNARYTVSLLDGLKNAGFVIGNEDSISAYRLKYDNARLAWRQKIWDVMEERGETDVFNSYSSNPFVYPDFDIPVKAESKTAIYVLTRNAGEGKDRTYTKGDYLLSDNEEAVIEALSGLYQSIILVLNVGGIVDLGILDRVPKIKAVLLAGQPGEEAGNAFADIISGKVNPSGKLTDTWALDYYDYPCAKEFDESREQYNKMKYEEGIFVGYRYFDKKKCHARFNFGYGLSYTEFEITAKLIEKGRDLKKISVEYTVKNIGTMPGKEVVELYALLPAGKFEKEERRFIGFDKTELIIPGEAYTGRVEISTYRLASFDTDRSTYVTEAGEYTLLAGNSIENTKPVASIDLDETVFPLLLKEKRKESELKKKAAKIAEEMTEDELVRMVVGEVSMGQNNQVGSAGISIPGSAGETSSAATRLGVAGATLADGPAGLRLSREYEIKDGKITPVAFADSAENGFLSKKDKTKSTGEVRHQYTTAFPVGTVLAQTFNRNLVEEIGEAVSREMRLFNVTLWLAPGMNIHRNPLCGRNFEYYSEDPLLTGEIAAAMTIGVQKDPHTGVTIKHFACNNKEDFRMFSDSVADERTLREIYLKGFEYVVKKADPMSVMTSYNSINGVHAANSKWLCTDVLRNEWGFSGVVMTDWLTTNFSGPSCTAAGCMTAGNDLIMPGLSEDITKIKEAVENGEITLDDVKTCAIRVIELALKADRYEEE